MIAGPLGLIGLIGLYIRMKLEETPTFQREAEKAEAVSHETTKQQFRETLIQQWKPLLQCVGLVLIFNVTDYMALSYLPSYLSATLKFNETHGLFIVLVVMVLIVFTGVIPSSLPALFPTKIRYGALAIGFNVLVSLFGGTTPLVTAWLVDKTGMLTMPAYYLMGASVIGIISVLALHETAKKPLKGSPPAVASHSEAQAVLRGHRVADEMDHLPEGAARA